MSRIGVVHVDSSFGRDGLAGAESGLREVKLKAAWVLKFDGAKPDFAPIIDTIRKSKVQSVIVIATGSQAADLIVGARNAGAVTQFVTLSNNSSRSFIELLGSSAHGVIVTQVFPNPRRSSHPVLVEFQKLSKEAGTEPSYVALEGFLSAKVLVEGLRRASAKGPITRARIIDALDTLKNFDLGGLQLSYGPGDHSGLDFIEISIINAKGEFVQ
jgi:ABC-type branched-subunit amino acid transport system substrate-binding protein